MSLDELKWDAAGLVTVVVQDRLTGDVRMVAHADREAVEKTLASGDAYFYSRSRKALWRKGETSGNTIRVDEVWADCDGDALLYLVDPRGPSCHTGARTCFYRRLDADAEGLLGQPTLVRLEETLAARASSSAEKSYTRSLLEKGAPKIGEKLREEADELSRTRTPEEAAAEAADVIYLALTKATAMGSSLAAIEAELDRRALRVTRRGGAPKQAYNVSNEDLVWNSPH